MLSKELEHTLNQAFKEAREKRHEFMTVEHLLLALLDNPAAIKVLKACGSDIESLRNEVSAYLDESTPPPCREGRAGNTTHPWLSASAATLGIPRAILGQEGSDGRQRTRCHLR